MLEEKQQTIKIKTLLMQCYVAEAKLATFLIRTADKYGSGLQLDELLDIKDMNEKISALLAEIKDEQDSPPDKLPVYDVGTCPGGKNGDPRGPDGHVLCHVGAYAICSGLFVEFFLGRF